MHVILVIQAKAFPEAELTNTWILVSCSCHKIPAQAFCESLFKAVKEIAIYSLGPRTDDVMLKKCDF